MANLNRIQYWDSAVLISYLTALQPERVNVVVRELIKLLEKDAIVVVISTLVIAEVRSVALPTAPTIAGREDEVPATQHLPAHAETIKALFSSDKFDYRVVTARVAQKAADIGNLYPSLLAPDCIHIATAIEAEADVLFTWDGAGRRRRRAREMLRYDGRIDGLAIKEPFVSMGPLFDRTEL